MSTAEEAAIVGRLILELKASRNQLAALRARAKEISPFFLNIGGSLKAGRLDDSMGIDENLAGLPPIDEINRLVSDARQVMETQASLTASLVEMGIQY